MANTVKIEKGSHGDALSVDEGHYPYGTSIEIDKEKAEALGLGDVTAGQEIELKIKSFVSNISSHENEETSEKRISLQITEMSTASEEVDLARKLYE